MHQNVGGQAAEPSLETFVQLQYSAAAEYHILGCQCVVGFNVLQENWRKCVTLMCQNERGSDHLRVYI